MAKLPGLGKGDGINRRIFLVLCLVSLLMAGFICYRIFTAEDRSSSDKNERPERNSSPVARQHGEDDSPAEPATVDPDPNGIEIAKKFAAAYMETNPDQGSWFANIKNYCDVSLCNELRELGPQGPKMSIAGEPAVTDSRTTYMIVAFPLDINADFTLTLGKVNEQWRVFEHEIRWR